MSFCCQFLEESSHQAECGGVRFLEAAEVARLS